MSSVTRFVSIPYRLGFGGPEAVAVFFVVSLLLLSMTLGGVKFAATRLLFDGAQFGSFETREHAEGRYRALLAHLMELQPDVICLNEVTPTRAFAKRLAQDLGFSGIAHTGLSILRCGPINMSPDIDEGDALLWHPSLKCLKAEREMLTGGVYGERLVANFGDATQIIGALLEIPGDGACGGAQVYVAAAHWRSTPIQNQAAAEDISHLRDAGCSKAELEAAQRAFSEGTSGRMGEAKTTIEFLKSHKNVILMGDFNATADTEEIRSLEASGLKDAFAMCNRAQKVGATWDPSNPNVEMQHAVDDRRVQGEANAERDVKAKLMQLMDTRSMRIDFCFVRGEVNALSSDVVMDRPITTSDKKKKKKKTKNADPEIESKGLRSSSDSQSLVPSDHFGVFTKVTTTVLSSVKNA